jgi:ribose transport system substrate-binding protein
MKNWTMGLRVVLLLMVLALVAAACSSDGDDTTTTAAAAGDETTTTEAMADETTTTEAMADETTTTEAMADGEMFTLGVSNTLVGNAWREQMVCAIKAEALARGNVDQVVLQNRNTDVAGQIADIIINPADREALDAVIEEAASQGIPVISVDAPVSAPSAYFVSNNQVEYGAVGAEWLFEALGGEGNVVYMRGLDGHPADVDRDTGFQEVLANYPGITIVEEVYTGWDPSVGAQQALEILTTQDVDGIWTSGIDYTVVQQFEVAGVDFVPVVGADNNEFVAQLLNVEGDTEGLTGAAISNPPSIGGVGAAIALDILEGKDVSQTTLITPAVIDTPEELEAVYVPGLTAGWSSYMVIEPYVHYTADQVVECKGPGE